MSNPTTPVRRKKPSLLAKIILIGMMVCAVGLPVAAIIVFLRPPEIVLKEAEPLERKVAKDSPAIMGVEFTSEPAGADLQVFYQSKEGKEASAQVPSGPGVYRVWAETKHWGRTIRSNKEYELTVHGPEAAIVPPPPPPVTPVVSWPEKRTFDYTGSPVAFAPERVEPADQLARVSVVITDGKGEVVARPINAGKFKAVARHDGKDLGSAVEFEIKPKVVKVSRSKHQLSVTITQAKQGLEKMVRDLFTLDPSDAPARLIPVGQETFEARVGTFGAQLKIEGLNHVFTGDPSLLVINLVITPDPGGSSPSGAGQGEGPVVKVPPEVGPTVKVPPEVGPTVKVPPEVGQPNPTVETPRPKLQNREELEKFKSQVRVRIDAADDDNWPAEEKNRARSKLTHIEELYLVGVFEFGLGQTDWVDKHGPILSAGLAHVGPIAERISQERGGSGDIQFVVLGYADKGTGPSSINEKMSKLRAASIRAKLIEQKGALGVVGNVQEALGLGGVNLEDLDAAQERRAEVWLAIGKKQ